MTTHLEMDEALAAQVEAAAKARGISAREFIRGALRQAVSHSSKAVKPARFVQQTHDFGTHIELPWTLLVDIESEKHLRNSRK